MATADKGLFISVWVLGLVSHRDFSSDYFAEANWQCPTTQTKEVFSEG